MAENRYDVTIWTDGSNDKEGHGGAAAVCFSRSGKRHIETYGEMRGATNQTMELMGAIIGLRRCWYDPDPLVSGRKRGSKRVLIFSDSAYLTNCFIQGWIPTWRKRGWRKGDGNPVKNRELWETLEALVILYKEVKFVHIRGHMGNANNELADHHANLARISMVGRDRNVQRLVAEGRIDEVAPDSRPPVRKERSKRRARRR
jgi:ribonuclease HI